MAAPNANLTPFIDPRNGITRRGRLERMRAALWEVMMLNKQHWIDLNDYVSPRKARWYISDRNRGDRRNQKIIDSTATFALRTLQSGMHAGMTNPARPWIRLMTPDPELNEYGPVKNWLATVTQRMLTVFSQTNLYTALPVHYGCKGLFATAATGILQDREQLFRCYSYPIGSYAIGTDAAGRINQWVYESQRSVLEIVEQFLVDKRTNMIDWTNATQTLRNAWDHSNYNTMIPVTWMVTPNFEFDPSYPLNKFKSHPFISTHFERGQDGDDKFLGVRGFNEFPVLVSRWDVTGDDWWGTDCPGMVALGDIKQLQTGERRSAQAVEKMVNPPLTAPTSVRNQKASLLPGDITYVDVREGQKGVAPIHETNLQVDKLEAKQQAARYRISRAFYEDLFLMLAHADPQQGVQPRTAMEIAERKEEKLIAVGPVIERSKDELHDPLIDRAFMMMDRAGFIPAAPQELRGMALKVEYISIMSQAQKLVGVAGHERFLDGATRLMAVVPEVKFKINWFQAIDDYNEMLGNDPKLVVPTPQAQKQADQAAQAQASAQQAQETAQRASAVKDLTGPMSNDSVLKQIGEQMQQG